MFSLASIITKLARQKNTSPHLGAVINAYSATSILYSPLTLMGVATTLYGLWGEKMIHQWLPWFTFPMLFGCMILFILIMMVLFYKVIIPSQVAFSVQQQYKHRNPLVTDMKVVLKKLEKLDDIEKRLKNLEKKSG